MVGDFIYYILFLKLMSTATTPGKMKPTPGCLTNPEADSLILFLIFAIYASFSCFNFRISSADISAPESSLTTRFFIYFSISSS
jgi:hypothetical protein